METESRIEAALEEVVAKATTAPCPTRLAEAIRYAVFPGGGRVRPGLCLAVAASCGDGEPALADGAAVAVELLHCASLVQDDLPCFDDAPVRRGQPSLHKRFGEAIAILVLAIQHPHDSPRHLCARLRPTHPHLTPAAIATLFAHHGLTLKKTPAPPGSIA